MGRKIWITGASYGIGHALAEKFRQNNDTVITSSRSNSDIAVDVTDRQSIKEAVLNLKQQHGIIDCAILNAGGCEYFDGDTFTPDIIERNFKLNFFSVIDCIAEILPILEQSPNPQLVVVSSAAAYSPFPRAEGYGAAKAALLYMMRSLQAHYMDKKLKISIVLPGFVATPLTAKNTFPMPFLMSAEKAANIMFKAIQRRQAIIQFPWSLYLLLKILNMLPYSVQTFILGSLLKQ